MTPKSDPQRIMAILRPPEVYKSKKLKNPKNPVGVETRTVARVVSLKQGSDSFFRADFKFAAEKIPGTNSKNGALGSDRISSRCGHAIAKRREL